MAYFLLSLLAAVVIALSVERARRPVLKVEQAEPWNGRRSPYPYYFLRVRILNKPLPRFLARWLRRDTAERCRVTVIFTSRTNERELKRAGRWEATPEVIKHDDQGLPVFDFWKLAEATRLDLAPGARGELIRVAVKPLGDPQAYAYSFENETHVADRPGWD